MWGQTAPGFKTLLRGEGRFRSFPFLILTFLLSLPGCPIPKLTRRLKLEAAAPVMAVSSGKEKSAEGELSLARTAERKTHAKSILYLRESKWMLNFM
jgi:hypothetical protein